ncbi:hypothetical protein [Sessilibacter sp. MAH4]
MKYGNKKVLVALYTLVIMLIGGCIKEENSNKKSNGNDPIRYGFAIDTSGWCKKLVNGFTSPGSLSYLKQKVDGYAIFDGEVMLAIPVDQINVPISEGMSLESTAQYIGFSGKKEFVKRNGFEVSLETYNVISKSEYIASERKPKGC